MFIEMQGNSSILKLEHDNITEKDLGKIGQLYVYDSKIVCGVSDGTAPIGVISYLFSLESLVRFIEITRGDFIGKTNKFDRNQKYPINANLYVNSKGKLTTRPITVNTNSYVDSKGNLTTRSIINRPCVAMVTSPPTEKNGHLLEFLWL